MSARPYGERGPGAGSRSNDCPGLSGHRVTAGAAVINTAEHARKPTRSDRPGLERSSGEASAPVSPHIGMASPKHLPWPCLDLPCTQLTRASPRHRVAPASRSLGSASPQEMAANASWKAPIVASTSASEWASEVKPASKELGAK